MKDISEQLKRFEYQTFEKTGDIYSLFYEKGTYLLKNHGYLAFITSNKWMRAGYGKTTRNFFLDNIQPELLVDLGSGVFEEATVDSNILIFKKQEYHRPFAALDVSKEKNVQDLDAYAEKMLNIRPEKDESWTISNILEQSIKAKIEKIGKPLKEWDIQINYGIKTGYNEAFIIDGKKKDELIAADSRSAEIIKPILRGRDIKRYKAEFADLWLINTHNGIKEKNIPRIDVEKDYPAIFNHLKQYEIQLIKRQDQGDHWSNLRNCAYIEKFEKDKIVYNDICQKLTFSKVEPAVFFNNTAYFISLKQTEINYFLSILNSVLMDWYYRKLSVQLGDKAVRMFSIYVENIPIPKINKEDQKPFITLVEQILEKKEKDEDTSALESQIDQMVYELYGLTEEEIAIVEGSVK